MICDREDMWVDIFKIKEKNERKKEKVFRGLITYFISIKVLKDFFFAVSRCLNGTFPSRNGSVTTLDLNPNMKRVTNTKNFF